MESQSLFTRVTGKNVLMSFTGPFDTEVLSIFGKNIENSISKNLKLNKTIFKVFIELAQNVSYYSLEKEMTKKGEHAGVGTFIIQDFKDYYYFILGNPIDEKHEAILRDKCSKINSFDREGLRAYKRELRKLPPGERGTGNIGLVQATLVSRNPLDYSFIELNDKEAFYIVAVKINKN
ncbi:MAG: SiaB family protein kinase [Bacteroidales bacterium]|nr:SiaB family protein kinase [Bacteroidales bacterium]